ncbi:MULTISPECIES: DUF3732 domain-containing protein [Acidobacterium]|uniref:Plasmid-related protein n=1 Tax=Acidobacterium capsulatum (strain ATCC 51196 / DSM 11244 / BCRC 80197 / JCM 7670 / NBRC 15755 / NCIMB 13165 / 161) TaxID=240015 RepID=C1F5T3_ACIC5|nr:MULTISPECIES: DUF3732 domain-containing protein [Acidobacterium]ACO32917.1 conserved hypothetical protein [Acidobacterium capsulatum ATCC 51196]HCT61092.1 DUF3732 domain-containing protein [Acidobacterium sp.]
MDFQISKIILWPKNPKHEIRTVAFERGRINVISGLSRTGKSAIVPIIDYCLGSRRCTIPTGIIRERTSWFGVVISTAEGEKLFARREPEQLQATDDMYLQESAQVEIPSVVTKNATKDSVKQRLDSLSMLSTLSFTVDDAGSNGLGRPSFRDLASFNFQPQNIVANPNVLFYKADSVKNRAKLQSIFPYVLGAVSGETLAQRHELQRRQRELKKKEADLRNIQNLSERWRATIDARVSEAKDLGLIASDAPVAANQAGAIDQLRTIASSVNVDPLVTTAAVNEGVTELNRLSSEEQTIAQELSRLRRRSAEMEQLRQSSTSYHKSLVLQRDRLQLSRWLSDQQSGQDCPLCNTHLVEPPAKLGELLSSLTILEEATSTSALPPSFDRELERVSSAISEQVERLKGIRIRQAALTKQSQAARDRQYAQMRASRFLGHLEADLAIFDTIGQDGELSAEVALLRDRVNELEILISEAEIGQRLRRALSSVNLFAGRLMPFLDAEAPNDPVSLSDTELTLKVQRAGREDFLWEIGSGSNWLSYHVAITLALHQFFLTLPSCPVPNFIVYDQPSQVYFPQRLADRKDAEPASEPEWQDEDAEAVRKVFAAMSQAMSATSDKFQVIVLDHAAKAVWGGVPLVHEVDEWRNGQALIPNEWMD